MPFENQSSYTEQQPKPWSSQEEINRAKSDVETSQKLSKANNVLKVLDFPDNQEESLRRILLKQDNQTLDDLAIKSKEEILNFLYQAKMNVTVEVENKEAKKEKTEQVYQQKETERIEQKISKIKSVFSTSILDKNPDIADKLESLDSISDPTEKKKVFEEILAILKEPWKLKSITEDLWGANRNNPQYIEFRDELVGLDSSFESYFTDLENISSWASFDTNEIISEIETDSGGIINFDMTWDKIISKMSLIGSEQSMDEEIDKQELSEALGNGMEELEAVQNSFAVLKGLAKPFDSLLSETRKIWGKPNFKENLQDVVRNISKEAFSKTDEMYETIGVDSDIQLTEMDILNFADINSPYDLRTKIESFKDRFSTIKSKVWAAKDNVVQKYHTEIKEILQRKSDEKEKQMEVLKFMRTSGFDQLPKHITDRLINDIQKGMLTIPGLELSRKNIDLKNGHFGESGAFIDKDAWLNIQSKTNLVKFVNKAISWTIDEPLWIEAITNGISVADPAFLRNKFLETGITNTMGWNYGKIIENLRKTHN